MGAKRGKDLMHRVFSVYGRKIISVILIFNALLTISCAVGILSGVYFLYPGWKPFAPFIVDGNLFWILIAAAVINIFPAAHLGKVHTGRLWFHHYVYGSIVIVCSLIWIVFFSSVSPFTIFFVNSTSVDVNVGRFFFIAGLTLFLDDLPDVHRITNRSLQWLKGKASQVKNTLHATQLIMGAMATYFTVAVTLSISQNPHWLTAANFILITASLLTALTSFMSAQRKVWLTLESNEPKKQEL